MDMYLGIMKLCTSTHPQFSLTRLTMETKKKRGKDVRKVVNKCSNFKYWRYDKPPVS